MTVLLLPQAYLPACTTRVGGAACETAVSIYLLGKACGIKNELHVFVYTPRVLYLKHALPGWPRAPGRDDENGSAPGAGICIGAGYAGDGCITPMPDGVESQTSIRPKLETF